ncbi:MAG: ABC transporter permease [Verrucomicrobiales bacterium]|nr:ABC transporter permease [Verrucomicrobiales bacterium]
MRAAKKLFTDYAGMIGVWLGLVLLFSLLSENFFNTRTLGILANRIPPLTMIAIGMTYVLIIAGIDLSVGSVLGLCGALVGLALVDWQWPILPAALLAMAAGAAVGTINGSISAGLGIPSFIVTLGMLEIARGKAFHLTSSQTKYIGAKIEHLAKPIATLGVSPAFIIAVGTVIIGQILLTRTTFGRYILAIGANETAAHLAGVKTKRCKIMVFAILGLLTGLAAVFYTSRLGSSDPNAGVGLELSAIAAVVVGGTSLMGGQGSVVNSFFGVMIIATLDTGLAQIGVSEPLKRVTTGGVIIAAVVIDSWRKSRTERTT